ncbi:MAG: tRNA (adenosine(37)-N6)-threonylcarbamoyltransferase complex ATPase subunit type 1 TsaE [Planctomycetaceae bacterium]|nr:tRNA (adenosine(37)-N6)-threonylcarbamoyltransferase complex ATPase subunit type 1 TsaE [Planctomycetaceae bacterium]
MPQSASTMTVTCQDEEQTVLWADRLSHLLQPEDIIALNGNLGAGKTRFVKAIAASLGIEETSVSSPTYTIVQSYAGQLLLHHFDLYRIKEEEELYESGCDEFLEGGGVCLIEWANRFPDFLPDDYLEVSFEFTSENSRELTLCSFGSRHERIINSLKAFLS